MLEDREAVVLEVKFNPDAAARFLENPKIMGISLGKSIRGNNTPPSRRIVHAQPSQSGLLGQSFERDSSQAGRLRRRTSRPLKRNPGGVERRSQ